MSLSDGSNSNYDRAGEKDELKRLIIKKPIYHNSIEMPRIISSNQYNTIHTKVCRRYFNYETMFNTYVNFTKEKFKI